MAVLGALGGLLGASWGQLGASWRRFGAPGGRLGGVLGVPWGVLGAAWGLLVASWGVFGSQKQATRLGPYFRIDFCSIFIPTWSPENQKNIDFSLVFQGFLKKLPLEVNIDF